MFIFYFWCSANYLVRVPPFNYYSKWWNLPAERRSDRGSAFSLPWLTCAKLNIYWYLLLSNILGRFCERSESFLAKKYAKTNSKEDTFLALSVTFSLLHSCSLPLHFSDLNVSDIKSFARGLQRLHIVCFDCVTLCESVILLFYIYSVVITGYPFVLMAGSWYLEFHTRVDLKYSPGG